MSAACPSPMPTLTSVPTRSGARDRSPATSDADQAALARDVSRRLKVKRKELRGLSVATLRKMDALIFDSLTGALRREFGFQALEEAVASASRPGDVSVIFLDADGLKVANDTQGYAAGDALLAAIVDAVEAAGVPRDQIARLGGDEFLAILPGADAPAAERLRRDVFARLQAQGRSVSSGAATFRGPGDSGDAMVGRAQNLMKLEKQTRPESRDRQMETVG